MNLNKKCLLILCAAIKEFIAQEPAPSLPKNCPRKFVLDCFGLLGSNQEKLIL